MPRERIREAARPGDKAGFGGWISVLAFFQASERRNIGRKGITLTIRSSVGAIPTGTI
jgi:hypothetical protein